LIDRRSKKIVVEDVGQVQTARFSPDGRLIFVVLEDEKTVSMVIRDAENGRADATVKLLENPRVGNAFLLSAKSVAGATAIALEGYDHWIELVPLFADFNAAAAAAREVARGGAPPGG
jgi:hypothetical protein